MLPSLSSLINSIKKKSNPPQNADQNATTNCFKECS